VIDTASNTVMATILVGQGPIGVAFATVTPVAPGSKQSTTVNPAAFEKGRKSPCAKRPGLSSLRNDAACKRRSPWAEERGSKDERLRHAALTTVTGEQVTKVIAGCYHTDINMR
jgi:hypothetical protein